MKKQKLQQLIDKGWEVEPEDLETLNRQEDRMAAQKRADTLAAAVNRVVKATEFTQAASTETSRKLDTLIQTQGEFIRQLEKNLLIQAPTDWEFDIQRNKGGFISKVYAKRTQ